MEENPEKINGLQHIMHYAHDCVPSIFSGYTSIQRNIITIKAVVVEMSCKQQSQLN